MGVKARPLQDQINFFEQGLLREVVRLVQANLVTMIRLDLQLIGLAEQRGQVGPIQTERGDNGLTVVQWIGREINPHSQRV